MDDKEMEAIRKQQDDMVNAGMREGIGQENYCLLYTSDAADES